jgi:hypothetical protein
MIYARVHDQTVADDYFAAMQRVEQRLDLAPIPAPPDVKEETISEVVKVQENSQLLAWVEILAQGELCAVERLEIASQLKQALSIQQYSQPVFT